MEGIKYCHENNIAHRDIKMDNILVTGESNLTVKIIDYGFSTIQLNDAKARIYCGTPSYMSPEIVTKKEFAACKADIWACGVLLYAMLSGAYPFKGRDDRDLYRKI